MMHRSLRLSAFLAGLAMGGLGVLFAFDNPVHIALAIGNWQLQAVPLWAIAIIPLVAGVAIGYLYHLPARMHHFGEHMKHRGLVHDLRKENAELSRSLDRLLAMPNDDSPAIAAAARARDVTPAAAEALVPARMEETVALASAPEHVAEHVSELHNGHTRRTRQKSAAHPEAIKDGVAPAAGTVPERPPRSARPGRAPRPAPKHVDPN